MASLRKKDRSSFWFACFTLPDGRRVQRSTKEKSRKQAQAKADEWERLSVERAKARQAHKVISDIYRAAHSENLPDATIEGYVKSWLNRKRREVSDATFRVYDRTATYFLDFLGAAGTEPLAELETRHFLRFRDDQADKACANTVNHYLKHLRIVFEDARREGYLAENPAKDCARLKVNKEEGRGSRRPFTLPELRKVLDIADSEMRSMILFGLYTGQRLNDIATLTWANLDLSAGELQLETGKTGRIVRVPLCKPLAEHVATLPSSDDPQAHLHPRAAGRTGPGNSNLFTDLLAAAGLVPRRKRKKSKANERTGDESRRRGASLLSFHSLRHTATSMMKNAGISPAVVQDIIGHQSAEMSAHYTHIESEVKREALESMPDLTTKGG